MTTEQFFADDFSSTLYPLQTNLLMISKHGSQISDFIKNKILSTKPEHDGYCFLPQQRVYSPKPRNHLRRTVCLDPIASYYLYDVVFRNRNSFRKPVSDARKCYGYRFHAGKFIPVHHAYSEFSDDIKKHSAGIENSLKFDIASYFNSIYHHDLINWFASLPKSNASDIESFGRFFREANAGRSVDFLPQGIYPAKMIGSEFLKFIDLSKEIKSSQLCRFMDDFYLFDNDETVLARDFLRIQELLGAKGLNVNPSKTLHGFQTPGVTHEISEIQSALKEVVEIEVQVGASAVDGAEVQIAPQLTGDQIAKLLELLVDSRTEESDVELILFLLQEHTDSMVGAVAYLITRFPSIAKQLHRLSGSITDRETLAEELYKLAAGNEPLIEFQVFWLAVISEDYLKGTKRYADLILVLFARSCDYPIARAKLLEIPDQWYGLKEIRDGYLKAGASHWLSWASAMGTRTLKVAERNYVLDYFSKGSPINFLIADCVKSM